MENTLYFIDDSLWRTHISISGLLQPHYAPPIVMLEIDWRFQAKIPDQEKSTWPVSIATFTLARLHMIGTIGLF